MLRSLVVFGCYLLAVLVGTIQSTKILFIMNTLDSSDALMLMATAFVWGMLIQNWPKKNKDMDNPEHGVPVTET